MFLKIDYDRTVNTFFFEIVYPSLLPYSPSPKNLKGSSTPKLVFWLVRECLMCKFGQNALERKKVS